jgi:uncharacterized protein (DUF1684 family)
VTERADELAEFRDARNRWAIGPRGPLALVNTQQVDHPQPVWPVAGEWAPAPGGLTVTATPDDGVLVDDVLVDGTVIVAGDAAMVPSSVAFADGQAATVVRTPTGQALRVWNPASEAVVRFARIDAFPDDPAWIVPGRFAPSEDDDPGTVADAAGEPLPVAGRVIAELGGHPVSFIAVRSAPFRGAERLQIIFQDATSALPEDDPGSSYSMGRFLYLDDPGEAAPVELDFNRAVLPPCALSYQYACPIPPTENRLPFRVRAGERHGLDVDGHVVH